MCVGYRRCMTLGEVVAALGLNFKTGATDEALREHYAFWPTPGKWFEKTPVRAFFRANFPALADYMDRNANDAEKLAKAIPQIARLEIKGESKRGRSLSKSDEKEVYQARKKLRAATTARRAIRDQRESTSRSAWSTVKAVRAK